MHTLRNIFRTLTRAERITFIIASCIALGAMIGLGTMVFMRSTIVVPASGGTLTEGVLGQPAYANPILAETDADKNLVRLLFANVLSLAEKTEADPTGRTWRVRLKENLRWSDGRKLTADDVIFTVQNMQNPETRSPLYASWQGVAANRLSEIEVQFSLVSPYPFFIENLRSLYPMPKHLFADTPPSNWRLSDFNLKPVGSGPYAFRAYEKRENGFIASYDIAANPNYVGDRPYIEAISFHYFAKNDELVAAFSNGAIDAFGELNPEKIAAIERPYAIASFPVPSYYAVFLNQSQHIALREPEVRAALVAAIDRGALVRDVFAGRAREAWNPLVGTVPAEGVAGLEAAVANLEAAGWTVGEDGIRSKTIQNAPIRLAFDLVVPRIGFLTESAARLETWWRSIGIEAKILVLSPEDITDRVIKNREYQAILFGNFLNPPHDLYPFWHSNERFHPGLNLALYHSEKADQLMDAVRRELDAQKRAEELIELVDTITRDAPAVFLYSPNYLYITARDVRGIEPKDLADPSDRYESVSHWHLRTTRAFK